MGRTLKDEIRRAHFARARMLLSGTELAIDEVAVASGFADARWFAKAFRDSFGESAAEYRRRNVGGANETAPAPS